MHHVTFHKKNKEKQLIINYSTLYGIALCLGVLVFACFLSYLVSAWTEPSVSPPGGNVDTPLNVSGYGQYKLGNLVLNITGNALPGLQVYGEHIPATGSPLICPANYVLSGTECIKSILYTGPNKVGIGTMNPQATLDVNGNFYASGSVGIGTNSPSQKLEVGGNILATGDVCNGEGKCLSSVFQTNVIVGTNPPCPTGQTIIAKGVSGDWKTSGGAASWTQVICGTAMASDGSPLLYGGAHSSLGCTNANGRVVTVGSGEKICRFEAAACPSLWTLYNNWTETSATCGTWPGYWNLDLVTYGHTWASNATLERPAFYFVQFWCSWESQCPIYESYYINCPGWTNTIPLGTNMLPINACPGRSTSRCPGAYGMESCYYSCPLAVRTKVGCI